MRVRRCVPECHIAMRMDVTVTGPSMKGAAGLPPPIAVTRRADVTVNLHANITSTQSI